MADGRTPQGAIPPDDPASAVDRKLGDEWSDWDGRAVEAAASAGKRLFITLAAALWALVTLILLGAWYLVAPRLAEWHPVAPPLLLGAALSFSTLLLAELFAVVLSLWSGWPLPRPLSALSRRLILSTERRVFSLGNRLAIDRDRIAHSLIKIHNALVDADRHGVEPPRVLVLLPRCLTKPQLREAEQLAADFGVKIAVVAGGELARRRIQEHRPKAVIGVACERDLLSGLRDVGGRLTVYGIPNTRPHGPCKDTVIDIAHLRRALELCTHSGAPPS